MPLYAADLGVSGLTVEVTEIADDKTDAVAATTTGITERGTTGIYYRNWTLNANTAMLYWQKQSDATIFAIGSATERDVDAILTDTGTTIPAVLGTPVADLATDIATVDTVVDGIQTDLDNGTDGLGAIKATADAIETDTADIQTRLPAALVGGLMSSDVTAISTSTDAADKLEASAETIETGAAIAGTLSTTQMTTDLTEATDDHYNGRIIIWTSGVLLRQATDITDYTGATKLLTFTAVTEAPTATDTFIIV